MESSDTGISDGSDTEDTGACTVCKRSSKNGYDRSDNGLIKTRVSPVIDFFIKVKSGLSFIKNMHRRATVVV